MLVDVLREAILISSMCFVICKARERADTRAPTALRPKRYTGYGHGAKYRGKRGVQGCKGRGKIGRKRKGSNRASPSFREREKMSEETG